jgi:hypothetical protein
LDFVKRALIACLAPFYRSHQGRVLNSRITLAVDDPPDQIGRIHAKPSQARADTWRYALLKYGEKEVFWAEV